MFFRLLNASYSPLLLLPACVIIIECVEMEDDELL